MACIPSILMTRRVIMLPNEALPSQEAHYALRPFQLISWTAIFIGALVGVGLGFLLNLFGIAIGLSAFTVNSADGAMALAIGGLMGLLIGVIAAMGVAGFTAGYLGCRCCLKHNLGIIYGFTTWSVALLLSALLAGPVSHYASSYLGGITHSAVVLSNSATDSAVIETQSNADKNQTVTKVTTSPSNLAWGAFTLFVLFFIGAVSSCFGAYWGMSCRREDRP